MDLSTADAMSLLHNTYGFQINRPGRLIKNKRISYNWVHSNQVVITDIVSWHTYIGHPGTFNSNRLAGQLGLSVIQLEAASKGHYSGSCLRLIMYIDQLYYYLSRPQASNRETLIVMHKELRTEFAQKSIGNSCIELLKDRDRNDRVREIKNHPETETIGSDLETWIREL